MTLKRRFLAVSLVVLAACGGGGADAPDPLPRSNGKGPAPFDPGTAYAPLVSAATLTPQVTNPLFPIPVGAQWVYQARTDAGIERIEISVLAGTQAVWGTTGRTVRDTVTVDGALVEDTLDWYAQDPNGHVWYLGEETAEYENGEVVNRNGTWTAGVNDALPGVVMLAAPTVGDVYRQEYLAGEAEDLAEVVRVGVSVQVPAGAFTGCVETRDRSAIDLELDELKTYCPGIGNVLVIEGDVRVELVSYSGL